MVVIVRVIVLAYIFLIMGHAFNLGIRTIIKDDNKSLYFDNNELINIPVGFGIASILTTFLYFMCGLTIQNIFFILLVLAIILTGFCLYVGRHDLKHNIVKPLAMYLITMIYLFVLAIPGLAYGDAEYVWRGNRWDKNIYSTEAIAAWTHPISYYDGLEADQLLKESETLSYGYNLLITDRPTAPVMCSLAFVSGSSYLFSMYLMYMLFIAMVPGAIMFLILGIYDQGLKNKGRAWFIMAAFIAILYPVSFWGQYIYDIDALSEMSSIALFVIATISAIRLIGTSNPKSITEYIYLLIAMVSGWILYFEDAVVHCFIFGAIAVFMLLLFRNRYAVIKLIKIVSVPLVGILAILVTNPRLFVFLRSNGGSAFDASRQNWSYFTQYWDGRYGISDSGTIFTVLSKIENTFLAWNGLWFITPDYSADTSLVFKMLWFGVDALVCLLILWLFIWAVVNSFKVIKPVIVQGTKKDTETSSIESELSGHEESFDEVRSSIFTILTVIGIAMFLLMVMFGKNWTANKMLMYISVYLYLLMLYPFLNGRHSNYKLNRLIYIPAFIIIGLQITLVGLRTYDELTNADHNGIDWNYPSDQDREVKEEYVFNYQDLNIDPDAIYILDVNDRLFQLYVKMNMAFDGIQPYNYHSYDFNGIESDNYYPDADVYESENTFVIGTQKRDDGKEYLIIRCLE